MVLIIDDNADLLQIFRLILSEEGYEVHTATSGEQALDILRVIRAPELILLDCSMPEMSGEEFLHALSLAFPSIRKSTTIIGLSSFSPSCGMIDSFKRLVTEYIEKPTDIDGLLAIVQRYCPLIPVGSHDIIEVSLPQSEATH